MESYSQIFEQTGWGLYSKFILTIIAFGLFANGIAAMSIPFALPLSSCDINMNDKQMIFIDCCVSLGMALGSFAITSCTDFFGRKVPQAVTLVLIFSSCLGTAFSNDFIFTAITLFCLGSGLTSNINISKIYLIESIPDYNRATCLLICDMARTLGCLLFSGICWKVMYFPMEADRRGGKMGVFRILFGVSGGLSILTSCALSLLLESPRFYLSQRKIDAALYTTRHTFCVNQSKHWHSFKIKREDLYFKIKDQGLPVYLHQHGWLQHYVAVIKRFLKTVKILVNKNNLKNMLLFTALRFSTMFGYVMLNLWLARNMLENKNENCHILAVDVLHLERTSEKCIFKPKNNLYMYFIILSSGMLLGQIITYFVVEKIDRKYLLLFSYVCCGMCSFCLAVSKENLIANGIISYVFMSCYSVVESILTIVIIENFPTAVRASALGLVETCGCYLIAIFKLFLSIPCQFTYFYIGTLMLASSTVAYFLPEQRRKPMVE